MLITKYTDGGNLHDHLQKNFSNITWKNKLVILWSVSMGYNNILNIYLLITGINN
jgi:hypothetical protein